MPKPKCVCGQDSVPDDGELTVSPESARTGLYAQWWRGSGDDVKWSHLWARGENVTQHSSSPSTETTGRGISR